MSYDNLLNKLVKLYESEFAVNEFEDKTSKVAPDVTDIQAGTAKFGPENIINVRIVRDETDPSKIQAALQSGEFYALYTLQDGKLKRYVKSKKLPNGVQVANGKLITNKGNEIDPSTVQRLQISEIITDRAFIDKNVGADNIIQYRLGYTVQDDDPRQIRVSGKKMTSFILDKKHAKVDPSSKIITISRDTPLKDKNTYKVDPSIFDKLAAGMQSLDRSREAPAKDRLQIKDTSITDQDIIAAGVDVADTAAVSKFIREHGFAVIPEEILKQGKDALKRYFEHNPVIQRYLRRMKKAFLNKDSQFVSPTARGETSEEGQDRLDANQILSVLGDDIFVIADDDVLDQLQ
jgi:hypothetical protein